MIDIGNESVLAKFYTGLSETANNLALSQLWLVGISKSDFAYIAKTTENNLQNYEGSLWNLFDSKDTYHTRWFLGDMYYLLAKGVTFPGDSFGIDYVGLDKTGLLKAPIGVSRDNLPQVTITFLETNQSVADLFFRPWMILASHWSLKEQSIRKPIDLVCFQKAGTNSSMIPRKKFQLEQAVPITIDQEELNYSGDKIIDRQIKFVYTRYNIVANNGLLVSNTSPDAAYKDVASHTDIDKGFLPTKPFNAEKEGGFFDGLQKVIDGAQKITDAAAQIYTRTEGYVNRLQTDASRALRAFGAEDAANSTDNFFNDVKDNMTPVGDVISTGQRYVNGAQSTANFGNNLVHLNGREQADKYASTQEAQQQEIARLRNVQNNSTTEIIATQKTAKIVQSDKPTATDINNIPVKLK